LATPQTRRFLEIAGLTKPDPVDDVIHYVLPNYKKETVDTSNYAEDVTRMLRAFATDSQAQREKLVSSLKTASIVMVKDAGSRKKYIQEPGEVYLAAARLTKLFKGVEDVFLVDTSYEILRGEKIREMLEACGATRILRTEPAQCDLGAAARAAARRAAGWEGCTSESIISDVDVAGLEGLLDLLPSLPEDERRDRALLLWEAMGELVDRRGVSILQVNYSWTYHQTRSTFVDARFLRRLQQTPWLTDASGTLRLPSEILFEDLGWPSHSVLEARIGFRPPAIAALAREVGIDADVLDELKRLGVTDIGQLRDRLKDELRDDEDDSDDDYDDAGADDDDGGRSDSGAGQDQSGGSAKGGSREGGAGDGDDQSHGEQGGSTGGAQGGSAERGQAGSGGQQKGTRGGGSREFISYVGARPTDEQADPDGLTQRQRMDLEEQAIALILSLEPVLERMPVGNTGFDLIERDVAGEPERWIEVKAMKGSLADRPVGLSSPQMEQARRCGDQFWLYVVERAGSDQARVLKIRNPHGRAGTFTFDRGWEAVANVIESALKDAAE
jgi:hypothetical protein